MFNIFKIFMKPKSRSKINRLPEDDLNILKSLYITGVTPENISLVMSISLNIVNYEIKQLKDKKEINIKD